MALNTIHKNVKDLVNVYNQTTDKKFKCELVGEKTSERIRVSLGLDLPSVKKTLKVNGHADAKENDVIEVAGETLVVIKIASTYDRPLQFRKRADYDYLNSTEYIFLE